MNSRNWVFDDGAALHDRALSLVKGSRTRASLPCAARTSPWTSTAPAYADRRSGSLRVSSRSWADGAPFPLLPQADSLSVFVKLRAHPRLDAPGGDWEFVPLRELHTRQTTRRIFDFDLAKPHGDLPVLTGGSFNLWSPDYGDPYAYAKASEVIPWLQERRRRSGAPGRKRVLRDVRLVGCGSSRLCRAYASAYRVSRCLLAPPTPER